MGAGFIRRASILERMDSLKGGHGSRMTSGRLLLFMVGMFAFAGSWIALNLLAFGASLQSTLLVGGLLIGGLTATILPYLWYYRHQEPEDLRATYQQRLHEVRDSEVAAGKRCSKCATLLPASGPRCLKCGVRVG